MNELLYNIEDVFSNYLIDNHKAYFNIPLYQRGYKWQNKQAQKVLEDVNNFQQSGSKFYCLQNITIVPTNKEYFNVVDGQQRLTTLTLILAYLGKKNLVKKKVLFPEKSIREQTNIFLDTFIFTDNNFPNQKWEDFIKNHEDFDHQDIYHLYTVYQGIGEWFEKNQKVDKTKFKTKLLKHVKLIVNNVEDNTSEETIFSNLNSKRIPLDGADLVRAILITRVANEEGAKEADIKNIVRVNERRVKIGWELDQINNWWGQQGVQKYFESFKGIKSDDIGGKAIFDIQKHPMNVLLLLFAESKGKNILTLEFFEDYGNNTLKLYKELIHFQNTIADWWEDKNIYHYLGFIFVYSPKSKSNSRTILQEVWELWEQTEERKEFVDKLKTKIEQVFLVDDELIEFANTEINWYEGKHEKLIAALILMDIISSEHKLPSEAFKKGKNDIEHIFPQNPKEQGINDKKEYVAFLNQHFIKSDSDKFDLSNFEQKKDEQTYQETLQKFIDDNLGNMPTHSIGNLVLLDASFNRSLGNKPYLGKRARVVEHFTKGNFIQPHTFKVFVRYFNNQNDENKDLEHWTSKDIKANAESIDKQISSFFSNENK